MSRLLIAAPLGLEAMIVKAGAPHARVRHTGMGPRRSAAVAASLACEPARALAVMGFCGALVPDLAPGDVVVASEVRGPQGTISCFAAEGLASALTRRGLRVHVGPIVSVARLARGEQRRCLAQEGAIAVDMESAWLAAGAGERMFTVVRAVVDTPTSELSRPLATVTGAGRAGLSLRTAAATVDDWTRRIRPRRALPAAPRAWYAGVDRAIEIVESALRRRGAPRYVRPQIVPNPHVMADLDLDGLASAGSVGGTAGGSAREPLLPRVVATLDALGSVSVHECEITQETVRFKPTAGLRKRG